LDEARTEWYGFTISYLIHFLKC